VLLDREPKSDYWVECKVDEPCWNAVVLGSSEEFEGSQPATTRFECQSSPQSMASWMISVSMTLSSDSVPGKRSYRSWNDRKSDE